MRAVTATAPISPTGMASPEPALSRARSNSGFTFLEILFAIALIGLASGILATNLGRSLAIKIKHEGRVLAAELEYVAQRAIARGLAQRWVVDLDSQRFRIEEQVAADGAADDIPDTADHLDLSVAVGEDTFAPIEDKRGSWRELDDRRIGIDEVRLRGENWMHGEVAITFSPDGAADPAEIWLLDPEKHEVVIRVIAFTGEIRVEEITRG